MIFTDSAALASPRASCSIRSYWDETENLWVDRDINAAINVLRVGLGTFPTIKRRKGGITIAGSITDDTSKEVLHVLGCATLRERNV
ncbi:hypothetical protein KBT16_24505 [Nostoc sp. CCCryo 231-06]|nr:hypothetical protein [Nostoc sp. CCCryo 231-06]